MEGVGAERAGQAVGGSSSPALMGLAALLLEGGSQRGMDEISRSVLRRLPVDEGACEDVCDGGTAPGLTAFHASLVEWSTGQAEGETGSEGEGALVKGHMVARVAASERLLGDPCGLCTTKIRSTVLSHAFKSKSDRLKH